MDDAGKVVDINGWPIASGTSFYFADYYANSIVRIPKQGDVNRPWYVDNSTYIVSW